MPLLLFNQMLSLLLKGYVSRIRPYIEKSIGSNSHTMPQHGRMDSNDVASKYITSSKEQEAIGDLLDSSGVAGKNITSQEEQGAIGDFLDSNDVAGKYITS